MNEDGLPLDPPEECPADCAATLERLVDIIDGNPENDIKGVRPRLTAIEERFDTMSKEWREFKVKGSGMLVGLGINIIGTIILVLALWKALSELNQVLARLP